MKGNGGWSGGEQEISHSQACVSQGDGAVCTNYSKQYGRSTVENKTPEICKAYLFFTLGGKAWERCNL